jgi:hypothetical protein
LIVVIVPSQGKVTELFDVVARMMAIAPAPRTNTVTTAAVTNDKRTGIAGTGK